jgi:hypothetical protein
MARRAAVSHQCFTGAQIFGRCWFWRRSRAASNRQQKEKHHYYSEDKNPFVHCSNLLLCNYSQ